MGPTESLKFNFWNNFSNKNIIIGLIWLAKERDSGKYRDLCSNFLTFALYKIKCLDKALTLESLNLHIHIAICIHFHHNSVVYENSTKTPLINERPLHLFILPMYALYSRSQLLPIIIIKVCVINRFTASLIASVNTIESLFNAL